MSMEYQLSREEEYLDNALSNGEIDQAEYNEELRELHRDFRDAAYEQEMEEFRDRLGEW